jgi:hypothetical protein
MKQATSVPAKVAYPIVYTGPSTVRINDCSSLHRVSVVISPPRLTALKK